MRTTLLQLLYNNIENQQHVLTEVSLLSTYSPILHGP